jgi:hypothetical protein
MSTIHGNSESAGLDLANKLVLEAAIACMSAMIYYLAAGLVLQFLRPDYSIVASPMSNYAVGPYGYLETTAFIFDGVSILALAIALSRLARSRGWSLSGLTLLGIVGAGRILEAAFPTDVPPGPVPRTMVGVIHGLLAIAVFICVVIATFRLSSGFAKEISWQKIYPAARTLAIASLATLIVFTVAISMTHLPNPVLGFDATGITEKIFLALWHIWILLTAIHLRSIVKS